MLFYNQENECNESERFSSYLSSKYQEIELNGTTSKPAQQPFWYY
jgi:hypothetical protein